MAPGTRLVLTSEGVTPSSGCASPPGWADRAARGWDPEQHPELTELVKRLATELLADDQKLWPQPPPPPKLVERPGQSAPLNRA